MNFIHMIRYNPSQQHHNFLIFLILFAILCSYIVKIIFFGHVLYFLKTICNVKDRITKRNFLILEIRYAKSLSETKIYAYIQGNYLIGIISPENRNLNIKAFL